MKIRLVGKPKDAPYLTPGKVYAAEAAGPHDCTIVDDEGELIGVKLQSSAYACPHAKPAKWEVVE